jgi:hypothetical protein
MIQSTGHYVDVTGLGVMGQSLQRDCGVLRAPTQVAAVLLCGGCEPVARAGLGPATRGQQGAVSAKPRRFCSAGEERPRPRQINPLRFDQTITLGGRRDSVGLF